MSKRSAPPSAHDVARLAGVSQAAVSRAFTPGASISEAMRAKVINAAATLSYRPNLLARSLITGQSGIIGVVIGNPNNPFFLYALDTLSTRLAEARQHLLVFTAKTNSTADILVEELLKFRVEALVLMSTTLSPALTEQCRKEGIPVVFFNRRAEKMKGFASVTGANYQGGMEIAAHLTSQGYRRLAYMAGLEDSPTCKEREAGLMAHLDSQGMSLAGRAVGHYDHLGAEQATRELLSLNPRPDAIFCANDYMALAAMEVARFEFGLQIGRQLGIAGFDDIEGARWRSFDLTTYSQPVEAMIGEVTDILLNPEKYKTPPHIVVAGELKVRSSTQRA